MIHDAQCELRNPRPAYVGASCGCGSRACPLCDACRDGLHTSHDPEPRCDCPLCEEAA